MTKTWVVMQHEFRVMVSRWSYRVFLAIVPVLAVLALAGIAVYQAVRTEAPPRETTAGYVDLTRDAEGQPIFTDHRRQGLVEFVPYGDVETATRALLDGEIRQLFVIPPDYLETGLVQQVRLHDGGMPGPTGLASPGATPLGRFLLSNLAEDLGPERTERIVAPFRLSVVEIDRTGQPVTDGRDFSRLGFYMAAAVLLIVAVFMSSGYMLQGLNEEKENRIMEVLLSSLRPEQLLVGKLLGLGATGLFQMLVWVLSGVVFVLVLGTMVEIPPGLVLLPTLGGALLALFYFVLGYFFFGTLMAALGAITTSQREANQVTFLVVLPGVAPLWFLQTLFEDPDGTLARVLTYIPFSAPTVSLVRLGLDSIGLGEVLLSLAVLAGFVALAMWLTARLFHAFLLMYGQRPGLRQMAYALRGG